MKIDRDEELIKKAFSSIYTKESNIKFNVNRKLRERKRVFKFKKVAVAVSILLSLVVAVPVMASTFPSFEGLLHTINSKFEDFLQPIQVISEKNGIKMEVVSAMKDEDMIVLYITLKDIEGNRIDETLDFNNSSRIKGINAYSSEVVDYNKQNKTATVRIQANSNGNFKNNKVEFSLGSFISGEKNIAGSLNNAMLADNLRNEVENTVKLNMSNIPGGSGELYNELSDKKQIDILEKDKLNVEFNGISCMSISNIGIINNQLHIQTKWDRSKFDNHGFLYLTDREGKKVDVKSASLYYTFDEAGRTSYGNNYIEYIFDLENIDLNNINLNADVFYSEIYVEGPWKTIFKLDPISEKKIIGYDKGRFTTINKIKISPLGIVILANDNLEEIASIKINMHNGTQEVLDFKMTTNEGNKAFIKFLSNSPINIKEVKSIDINGDIILVE